MMDWLKEIEETLESPLPEVALDFYDEHVTRLIAALRVAVGAIERIQRMGKGHEHEPREWSASYHELAVKVCEQTLDKLERGEF